MQPARVAGGLLPQTHTKQLISPSKAAVGSIRLLEATGCSRRNYIQSGPHFPKTMISLVTSSPVSSGTQA